MKQLYAQLDPEYIELHGKLVMARKTWELFGLGFSDLYQGHHLDDLDREMIKIAIE